MQYHEVNLRVNTCFGIKKRNSLFEFFVVLEDPLVRREDRDVRLIQEVRDLVDRVGLYDHTHLA